MPVPYTGPTNTWNRVPCACRTWAALPTRFPFASRALGSRFGGVHTTRIPTQAAVPRFAMHLQTAVPRISTHLQATVPRIFMQLEAAVPRIFTQLEAHAFASRSSTHFHATRSRSYAHFHAIRNRRSANFDDLTRHAFPTFPRNNTHSSVYSHEITNSRFQFCYGQL